MPGTRQVPPRAPAAVGEPVADQTSREVAVMREVSALVEDRAVPLEAINIQCTDDGVSCARLLTWRIDVFDAQ